MLTISKASHEFPTELGLFAARPCYGGETLGSMLDGREVFRGDLDSAACATALASIPVAEQTYLYSAVPG